MEIELFQDVATIVTFIAPGYFAMQIYSLMHAKREREFSRLLIESIVYSLPIVALAQVIWRTFSVHVPSSFEMSYVMLLIGLAIIAGIIVAFMRLRWPLKQLANLLNINEPNHDFVKAELERIDTSRASTSAVTVQLKSGTVFSGTVDSISRHTQDDAPMHFNFANIAWFNETTGRWDEREGNVIIARDEIEFIETKKLADK